MLNRKALYDIVRESCRGYDYDIRYAVTTNSVYVNVQYNGTHACMRFSDHKGKVESLKSFDYTAPSANVESAKRFIRKRLRLMHKRKLYDLLKVVSQT